MTTFLKTKSSAVLDLIRFTKPYGTLLLLMPTLWSLVVASNGTPPVRLLMIFMAGSFIMRSAGCVINDIADRNFDGHVIRTRSRPLPSGRLTLLEATVVFGVLLATAFWLVLQLNRSAQLLSLGGIAIAVLYPFSKRIIHLPQMVMGVAFGWGSVMAWVAVRDSIEAPILMIFLANLFWATAYDTIYALMDREDDIKIGVKSSAILFGRRTWIAVGGLYAASSCFFLLLGLTAHLGTVYYVSIGLSTVWFVAQARAVRLPLDRNHLFSIFRSNVAVGFLVLLGLVLDYHLF
jgi:4-hydroxybenzoate polyprenyltransferase